MIRLLVAGTVAYDSIETPFGKAENVLGGSALHFVNLHVLIAQQT
jgi:hypothetical protein